jgi:hypothetical protein
MRPGRRRNSLLDGGAADGLAKMASCRVAGGPRKRASSRRAMKRAVAPTGLSGRPKVGGHHGRKAGFGVSGSVDTPSKWPVLPLQGRCIPPPECRFRRHQAPTMAANGDRGRLQVAARRLSTDSGACSIRRSDHPSRPSASTGCLFSSPKTLLIPAVNHVHRLVSLSAPLRSGRFSGVRQWPVLGVPPTPGTHSRCPERYPGTPVIVCAMPWR